MKEKFKSFFDILVRYVILILIAVPNLWLFYFIFTPLTANSVFFLLNLFYDAILVSGKIIIINRTIPIELVEACIAGAAYYLLLILNLSTPGIKTKKRIKMILLSFLIFLIANILRIFFLSFVAISGSNLFDITHIVFWYAISTLFVVAIWFAEVKIFRIKSIPFYSDIKFLSNKRKKRR